MKATISRLKAISQEREALLEQLDMWADVKDQGIARAVIAKAEGQP